jgi:hypothetical protein
MLHAAQWIFFWILVIGALGPHFSSEKTETKFGEKTKTGFQVGVANPMVQIAWAILAIVFRPW